MPAHAADPTTPAPTVPGDPTTMSPAAATVDTTAVAASQGGAAATQTGATNINISVRIGSPGDAGAVDQTVAAIASAATQAASQAVNQAVNQAANQAAAGASSQPATQTTAPPAGGTPSASTQQSAPTNLNVSVRVESPGNDGSVAQTTSGEADTTAAPQYQAPAPEYQPDSSAQQPAPDPAPPISSSEPPPTASAQPTNASTFPSSWTWNWSWTCGDTTPSGTTQAMNTGIQGWNWNWNLGGVCSGDAPTIPKIDPVFKPESSTFNLVLPTPPDLPAPVLPATPQVRLPPPIAAVVATVIDSADMPAAPSPFSPVTEMETPRSHSPPAIEPAAEPAAPAFTRRSTVVLVHPAAPSSSPAPQDRAVAPEPPSAAPSAPAAPAAPPARHTAEAPTELGFSLPLPGGGAPGGGGSGAGSGGGGGGSGSGGVAAALALFLLLGLPGLAVLRLPAGRRAPRAYVDEPPDRPG